MTFTLQSRKRALTMGLQHSNRASLLCTLRKPALGGDPAARKLLVVIAWATHEATCVLTPGFRKLLEEERPEVEMRDTIPDAEVLTCDNIPDMIASRKSGNQRSAPVIGVDEFVECPRRCWFKSTDP